MDRREFLKSMGVMATLTPLGIFDAQADGSRAYINNESNFHSPTRVITIGDTSLFDVHENFNSSIEMLRIDKVAHLAGTGMLKMCSELLPPIHTHMADSDWRKCERDMQYSDLLRVQLKKSEKEISGFIGGTEWLFIYAVLDNAMTFEATEYVSRMARLLGVKTLAFVATPYDSELHHSLCVAGTFDYPSEKLINASQSVVKYLQANCNGVFHDDGVWHWDEPWEELLDRPWDGRQVENEGHYWFSQQHVTINVLSELVYRNDDTERMFSLLSNAGNCAQDSSVEEGATEALNNAIFPYYWANKEGRNKHVTSGGAIICVTGEPNVAEKLRQEILIGLSRPEVFHRDKFPSFWRDKSEFVVTTRHCVNTLNNQACVVTIFSTNCIC